MRRRKVMVVLGSAIPLAGCVSFGEGAQNGTPDREEDVFIVLQNSSSHSVTISISVATRGEPFFEKDVTIEADEVEFVYPDITSAGEYTFTMDFEDRQKVEFTFDIGGSHIDSGSNVVVWIDDENVDTGIEE